jgi:hypothetical protein
MPISLTFSDGFSTDLQHCRNLRQGLWHMIPEIIPMTSLPPLGVDGCRWQSP